MKIHVLEREIWLPRSVEDVFPFFAEAGNLETLTPPTLRFEIVTPRPIEMREGAVIDYRLKVHHIPLRWRSEITAWEPPHRFVDTQLRGPYRRWVHEHRFSEERGGTLARDRVEYAAPGGWLVHQWLVRPDLERIFDFREKVLREKFRK